MEIESWQCQHSAEMYGKTNIKPEMASLGEDHMAVTSKKDKVEHQIMHSNMKLFHCNDCEKSFTRKYNLVKHYQRTHSGEKTFQCSNCEKSYSTKSDLVVHRRTHSVIKLFQ